MIHNLTIHNIALIEHISVHFHPGMTVLSGETGAGKSIIVDAVTLLLGGRADKDLIRSGCDKASVEAEFNIRESDDLNCILDREGIEAQDLSVTVFREISRSGRNICRINGTMVSVSVLKEIVSLLLNLHGQSEHQFLADDEKHLAYLDLMGDASHQALLDKINKDYQLFITNHREYARLVKLNENRERRMDSILRELEELHHAAISPGEEEKLTEESKRLIKSSRIHDRFMHACSMIGSGEEGTDVFHSFQTAIRELRILSEEDPVFVELAEKCEGIYYEIEDIVHTLNELKSRYDFDPSELETTENRLESVRKVLKKYGPSEKDVLDNQYKLEKEYELLQDLDRNLQETGAKHKKLLSAYRNTARELTAERKKIAEIFQRKMMDELKDLGMDHTVLEVCFESNNTGKPIMPSPAGDDRICFMISPNPGEPLKPISKIASGGELSRLMLALKTIESGKSGVQTMIFDEIDTGISGRMAQAVAEKMISISEKQQVICISHLPQIAASADHQILVYKTVSEGRTKTEVLEMGEDERREEIARMISGAQGISEDAKIYAGQMILAGLEKKKSRQPGSSNS